MATATADLRYPVGNFAPPREFTAATRRELIQQIVDMPAALAAAIDNLTAVQLETPYRPGGWTLHQVCHHIADSHMNAFIRHKFALTQDTPTIMAYDEARWATTPDYLPPAQLSVQLLD